MSLKEQALIDAAYIVSNTDELARDVIYERYSDGSQTTPTAILDNREFNDTANEGRLSLDTSVCFIQLEFEPEKYDKVIVDATTYKVDQWNKSPSGYKLLLVANEALTRKHTTGRFR